MPEASLIWGRIMKERRLNEIVDCAAGIVQDEKNDKQHERTILGVGLLKERCKSDSDTIDLEAIAQKLSKDKGIPSCVS
ncbi:MAG: hypothetical protein ACRDF4_06520 [Rhabdochlamydiaceae bacterium]